MWRVVVDNGKPYEQEFNSKKGLFKELRRLQEVAKTELIDIFVYEEQEVTATIFKELNKNKGEEYGRRLSGGKNERRRCTVRNGKKSRICTPRLLFKRNSSNNVDVKR